MEFQEACARLASELVPNGGAFGGKEDASIQPHAGLLAKLTGRPVKLTLSREDSSQSVRTGRLTITPLKC